jgi:hypothetical protein
MKTAESIHPIRSIVNFQGEVYTLIDYVNERGRVIDSELFDNDGDSVFDEDLLQQALNAVDICFEW